MVEYQMTGYLKRVFVNQTGRGKVANFFIKGDGYMDEVEGRFVNNEYALESWLPELIKKLEQIPRESLVTVFFNIVPKISVIEQKNIYQNKLKATRIICWDRSIKESPSANDEELYQLEIPLGGSASE